MKRVVAAILGVVVAVAVLVVIARANPEKIAPAPAPAPAIRASVSASVAPATTAPDPGDVQLEVKEIVVADASAERTSIRIEHPDPGVQEKLRAFLEPREQAALARNMALDCHALLAKTSLISITCVSVLPDPSAPAAAGDAGPKTQLRYESLTLRVVRGEVKQLTLADVLSADAGQNEVVEACKKAAEPDLACEWPPTDFALSPAGTLFICHGPHCIDIDQADAPGLLRPEFR